MKMKDFNEIKKEFEDLLYKELGVPKDLMTKGAVEIENGKTKIDFREHAPKLDIEEFNRTCDEMRETIRKMAKAEEKRQDEMLILQILYVYETGMDFWHYKAIMLKMLKEVAKEKPNDNFRFQMLTKEQVEFINSIKRTSRDEMEAKFYDK